jgi:hypothetical protein
MHEVPWCFLPLFRRGPLSFRSDQTPLVIVRYVRTHLRGVAFGTAPLTFCHCRNAFSVSACKALRVASDLLDDGPRVVELAYRARSVQHTNAPHPLH